MTDEEKLPGGSADAQAVPEDKGRQASDRSWWWRKWDPEWRAMLRGTTAPMVEAAQVRGDMQVLDVASGMTGEPALTLAAAVAPHGRVTATDRSPAMLIGAEKAARERGLSNIAFQQADAAALPFPDGSFDAVTCRFALMFFPDVGPALREAYRVLRRGGRAVFMVFGPYEQSPYFTSTIGILIKYVDLPTPAERPEFRFGQPATLSAALRDAGFERVEEETRVIAWTWPGSAEHLFASIRERPMFRPLFARVAPEQQERVTSEIRAAIRQYDDGQQLSLPTAVVLASGTR